MHFSDATKFKRLDVYTAHVANTAEEYSTPIQLAKSVSPVYTPVSFRYVLIGMY